LEKEVAEGRFRADLYYRLNVIPMNLPSLRQRTEDIPLLVDHFLKKLAGDGPPKTITRESLQFLMRHAWPGNVRELENVIERAARRAACVVVHAMAMRSALQIGRRRHPRCLRFRRIGKGEVWHGCCPHCGAPSRGTSIRRDAYMKRTGQKGFTLIELMIVVLI